ncbi:MAG: PAS domain-containing sensor histidine kinase [Chloroflexi bacterium]|jgi:two-component system phosphate regulon sensor histidine kinase PhoR|uniref:histidine kinase n=1 Tax=Candidatus Thermofonsia Clade 3 bacterium TaxID=2364212 RepID=A0A2M8QBC1_9CHLR|nr:ATP-binding protein [Candidatus Roseilinea sp. NK_OTU-006]PJF47113.1 MAG: PAS domain-containing sensor histidine kinase [Candidatus Thermofonsia Clade 3 bacterium]RMG64950.1 MAG: PAS domain-containing sensor histidine kinase [Chloroflexota bacterium]
MNTAFVIGVTAVSFLVIAILLTQLRRALDSATRLGDTIRRLRRQLDTTREELARCQEAKAAMGEAVFDPVIFVDNHRQITACNHAADRLGICKVGHSLIEATRSYELDSLAGDTIAGRTELSRQLTLHNHLFRAQAARFTGGAVIVLRDVSELQRLGRARRDFVANISHELRTPLTAMSLLLDTFRAESANITPAQQRLLGQMQDQTESLTQLVQELSELTQIESGQMPMRMLRASLYDVANAAITRLSPQAERAGLRMINAVPEAQRGLFDPDQIRRVLSNLLHNAIKFTPQGQITVFVLTDEEAEQQLQRLRADPNGIDLTAQDVLIVGVRDTGVGIPHEELPRIFERFYKVDRARGQGGTGLGLSIAKHIVEAHGGRIWAESTLGKGTTFYFTVPRED